ncbi:nickel-dependent lactate racemase [Desulfitispora alkaliphila]|uniref:nickel-dependent lactate racemase n=1 Tax=Desulfitispora alkaliphila TaxID=622674 RepID=UPI003D1B89B7
MYSMAWGKTEVKFKLPEEARVTTIEANHSQPIANFEDAVRHVLRKPTGSPALRDIVAPGDTVAIVTSDITRLSYRTDAYLPIIIDELNQAGVEDQDITIVMSTGTHRSQSPEEHKLVVGEAVYKRVKVVDHWCKSEDLVYVGETSYGTEVTSDPYVYNADKVILTGGISYHLLAGFGGGRKGIAPGVCGYKGIQQNHSLALKDADDSGLNPNVGTGMVKENPVSLDMVEAARMIGADFLVNVVLNENKEFIGIVAGDMEFAFEEGCKIVENTFGIPISNQSDLVITSCGGYPKDIQLYQSVKALDNAAYAVKPGGVIILLSQCSDGVGSDDFANWFQYPQLESMKKALNAQFTMPGFVALRAASIMNSAKVILISDLPDKVVQGVNMHPAKTVEEALQLATDLTGSPVSITLMPHGTLTFPILT